MNVVAKFIFLYIPIPKWIFRIYIYICGGVKPRPTIEAQEHRFIKSTPEEEKSLRHVVGNTGAHKCPRRLVREEHPPRI